MVVRTLPKYFPYDHAIRSLNDAMTAITLIEDDVRIRQALAAALTERGHVLRTAATAMEGLQLVVANPPDLVILDLGLPDLDGRELLRMIRAVSDVPVIVATARDSENDIVRLLDTGADDYLVKPFGTDQLEARIRAVLRRRQATGASGIITIGELRIDSRSHEATLDGRRLELSRKEFDLLAHLASKPGVVVTKAELLAEVWRQPWGGADKTVDVHLSWLRKKLGETADAPRFLRTIRGVGVKLVTPGAAPGSASSAGESPIRTATFEPPVVNGPADPEAALAG